MGLTLPLYESIIPSSVVADICSSKRSSSQMSGNYASEETAGNNGSCGVDTDGTFSDYDNGLARAISQDISNSGHPVEGEYESSIAYTPTTPLPTPGILPATVTNSNNAPSTKTANSSSKVAAMNKKMLLGGGISVLNKKPRR